MTLVAVPLFKLAAAARQWQDEHVYLQVQPGACREVLDAIAAACTHAGITLVEKPAP